MILGAIAITSAVAPEDEQASAQEAVARVGALWEPPLSDQEQAHAEEGRHV